jgi:Protein of unknown function (DUF3551)
MKAMLLTFGFAAPIVAAAMLGAAGPAQAQNYPWCAYYAMGDDGGGTNCGFVSYEQCMATLSGMGGFCVLNNQYHPPTGPAGQHRAARPSHKHRS